MSKKTLKRSLTLGALMAFVITGNVWAANMTNQVQADEINENTTNYVVDGAITASESDIIVSGNKDATILTVNGGKVNGSPTIGIGYYNGTENKSVKIKNIKELYVNSGDYGVAVGEDNLKYNGQVYIDESVGKTVINGNTLGVYSGGGTALVQIESKDVTINGGLRGLMTNQGGTIQLGTKENEIEKLVITSSLDSGSKSHAIRSSNTKSNINILAETVNLSSNHTAIRSHGGNVYLGSVDNLLGRISAETHGIGLTDYSNAVVDFSAGNGRVELYANEVSLINHKGTQNAISVGSTGTLKIVAKDNLLIKGNITSCATTPIIDINTGINDALVKIEGDISLTPNGNGVNNGTTKITLGAAGSYLKGKVTDAKGGVTLTMNEGTTWNVTGDSVINSVVGNGTIKVGMVGDELASVSINNALTVEDNIKVSGNGDVADFIAGSANQDAIIKQLSENVTAGGKVITTNVTTDEGKVAGAYTATIDEQGKVIKTEAVNNVNKSIGEASVVGRNHIRAHMNDMNKRMGELRMANGELGVWTRMVRGEEEFDSAKSQYNQYQLGYDEKLSVDKRWTVGAAVTFAEGNGNFANGSTENDSTAFAIYGSKLNNDGTFVDLIARYARLESDITLGDAKADYSTNGVSVSAEFGKRIEQGNGLWIEPQVELTYGTIDSAEYEIDGRNVHVSDMNSLIGRVGFSLGKDIKQGNVYARASYLYDFDGETEITFGNGNVTRPIAEDIGGGWLEVGVGANINLSKATYIYADVEKTFGGEVDTTWKWNLGVRYSF